METFKITDEYIQERIDKYLVDNKKEIDEYIDKKIERAVKLAINEEFSESYKSKSLASKIIKDKIEKITEKSAREVIVDKEDIVDKTQKKVNREVNKMIKNISFTEKEKSRGWY